ncbi:MAG: class I SAM-dependent methyltransferase [Candidatus Pacearchaeota archaeon]
MSASSEVIDEEMRHAKACAYKEFQYESMNDIYKKWPLCIPSRHRVNKIMQEVEKIGGKKIIDLGCEAGFVSRKLLDKKKYDVYAIDICHTALDEFKRILDREGYVKKPVIKQAFIQEIPFEDNLFDIGICTEVIEHSPKLDVAFKEMSRVIKKDGYLIITFPIESQRDKVYPLAKLLGMNVDVLKEVTLYDHSAEVIMGRLSKNFTVKKHIKIPRIFPITNLIVCKNNK